MKKAPIPANEKLRLKALLGCSILDTESQSVFDQTTQLAAEIYDVPICLVSLIDSERQWFKSRYGLDVSETSRDISFCGHVVDSEKTMVILDATKDERFADNPFVTGDLHLRFYAGAPVLSSSGYVLGTLCLIDTQPRSFTEAQKGRLESLAQHVSEVIELNKANVELKELVRQNREIEKLSKTGAWTLDPKTQEVTWSEEVYHIHKVPVGTPTNKIKAINFYAEHERERIAKCVEDCVSLYRPYDEEFEFVDAEGIHKWVRARGEPVLGLGGELVKLSGVFQDITSMKRREVALQRLAGILKENHKRLEIALDAMDMGVCDFDFENETLVWDERYFQIFGEVPNQRMSGKILFEKSVHPEDRDRIEREKQEAIDQGQTLVRCHYRIIRSEGEVRHLNTVSRIIYENKKPIRMVGVAWDCTKEFLNEEELQRQRKMTQHNAKLAAIGELAAGVAHEINNPLTIINGFVNLLGKYIEEESWDKELMIDMVEKVDGSCDRIAKIVKGLRNFSRVDKEVISRFDLVETIEETISMLAGIYHKEGVIIEFGFESGGAVFIEGNRGKIQQVLINLISNAKDATDHQSSRKVEVSLKVQKNSICIHVHDNGPGVPKELRERVFEPFFTTKDVNKGTGIGLSLVHSIVSEHNGYIHVEDSDEPGATFTVELPSEKKAA